MNSPISGILAFLLFAYCTPTQGYRYTILEAKLENNRSYSTSLSARKTIFLVALSRDTYGIEETIPGIHGSGEPERSIVEKFKLEGVDTMMGEDVVLRTEDNSFIRMQLVSLQDSRRLFDATTRFNMDATLSTYDVSAVYEYQKSDIMSNVSISEFEYTTKGVFQRRLVIHSGRSLSLEMGPLILWAEQDANYSATTGGIILTLRPKPADETYRYYLVKFKQPSDSIKWMNGAGRGHNSGIRQAPKAVTDFFRRKA